MTCFGFMCTHQFFPMTFSRYHLLLFLFHSLEVHFMNSYNNDQMSVGPLSIKTKHLSLVLSKHRKYRAASRLSLSVLFIEQCYGLPLKGPECEAMNGHVSLAVSISCKEFSNLKRIEKKIEKSSVKPIIGEGI